MTRILLLILIGIILLFSLYKIFFQKKLEHSRSVFILPNTQLDISALEFIKQTTPPGKTSALFIIPTQNIYVVARFSWLVTPIPTPNLEETYIMQNGILTPIEDLNITYNPQTEQIHGSLPDNTTFMFKKKNIISINDQADFNNITLLPGWENAHYIEK